ncbi:hypothetical protein C8R44DRAFT_863823 [Mycena epipterygia]|nr:hypothetical protein C8R44DRAFT_863823 [Mycena epipterygia]
MDSQTLPVVNSVAPILPHVAQLTKATPKAPPPISSSARSMTSQTNASFTMLSRQAKALTDSLINSLLDTSAPSTPAAKRNAAATSTSTSTPAPTSAPASTSVPASTPVQNLKTPGKAESAAAGVKRLDSNMGALASRLEDHIDQCHHDMTLTRGQVKTMAQDMGTAGLGASNTFTARDMLDHPTFRALLDANNSSVSTIEELCTEIASLHAKFKAADHKRKREHHDTVMYSEDVFLPTVKRVQTTAASTTTLVQANTLPPVALAAPPASVSAPTNYYDVPTAPPPTSSIPEAPPAVPANKNNGTGVDVGPVAWGKDISGQVHGLIACMPRGNTINSDTVRELYTKRFHKNNRFITVYFPTNITAIQFVNAWATAPAPGYEKVSVSFASGN